MKREIKSKPRAEQTGKQERVRVEFTYKKPLSESKASTVVRDTVDVERFVKIALKLGFHMRPAATLVEKAQKSKSSFEIHFDGKVADATSIMGLMMLAAEEGSKVKIKGVGKSIEEVEREFEEILSLEAEGEGKLFGELKIDLDNCVDVREKVTMLAKEIESGKKAFHLIIRGLEAKSKNQKITEGELQHIAKGFHNLANLKGMRNDILILLGEQHLEPEIELEIEFEESGTFFHFNMGDGIKRIVEAENVNADLMKQFHHAPVVKPMKEFQRDLDKLLDGQHAYEVKRNQGKFDYYCMTLEKFLEAPLIDYDQRKKEALSARMQYEHHKFIEIKK